MKGSEPEIDLQLVAVRVPKAWQLRKVAGAEGYMTLTEFLRFLIKKEVDEHWKKQHRVIR